MHSLTVLKLYRSYLEMTYWRRLHYPQEYRQGDSCPTTQFPDVEVTSIFRWLELGDSAQGLPVSLKNFPCEVKHLLLQGKETNWSFL